MLASCGGRSLGRDMKTPWDDRNVIYLHRGVIVIGYEK